MLHCKKCNETNMCICYKKYTHDSLNLFHLYDLDQFYVFSRGIKNVELAIPFEKDS